MLLKERCSNLVAGIFGDIWKVIGDELPQNNILKATERLVSMEGEVGYSTNGYKVLEWALNRDMEFDRIVLFTDGQMWDSYYREIGGLINQLWNEYKSLHKDTKLYIFNLSNYAQSSFNPKGKDVYTINGWSEQIFKIMANVENGEKVLNEINNIIL
jgi:hypothetical protein